MLYLFGLAIAAGFGIAVAAFAGALGQARAVASAVESVARQPEAGGRIFTSLVLGLAFIESLVLYTLLLAFLVSGKLPDTDKVLDILARGAGG
jgi:F-type H+-transporting ATPase subunit c